MTVPADQGTADRETIAQAIVAVELGFAHMDPGPALIYADAVLAVLVPADQQVVVLHVSTAPDMEVRAGLFNEGYEAAMTQHLADDPSAAEDWLAKHDARVCGESWLEGANDGWTAKSYRNDFPANPYEAAGA